MISVQFSWQDKNALQMYYVFTKRKYDLLNHQPTLNTKGTEYIHNNMVLKITTPRIIVDRMWCPFMMIDIFGHLMACQLNMNFFD